MIGLSTPGISVAPASCQQFRIDGRKPLSGLPDIGPEYEGLDVIVRLKPLPARELIRLVHSLLGSNTTAQKAVS